MSLARVFRRLGNDAPRVQYHIGPWLTSVPDGESFEWRTDRYPLVSNEPRSNHDLQ